MNASIESLSKNLFCNQARKFSSGVANNFHVPAKAFPSIAKNQKVTERIIGGSHTSTLKDNVIINKKPSSWRHLELTKDHIRIEYEDTTQEYKESAELFFESDEELMEQGIPLCFKPTSIENNVSIGAGATIYLDRDEVADFLREHQTQLRTLQKC